MARETYQAVSTAINLTASNSVDYWMTHPSWPGISSRWLIRNFSSPILPVSICARSPEADFEVIGGTTASSLMTGGWNRPRPGKRAHDAAGDLGPGTGATAGFRRRYWCFRRRISRESVRQALRDYTRPDRLATNPLVRSRLVVDTGRLEGPPAVLQALLREAAATLTANPKDTKFHRAIWHTYFEPAPTQEQAAELLRPPLQHLSLPPRQGNRTHHRLAMAARAQRPSAAKIPSVSSDTPPTRHLSNYSAANSAAFGWRLALSRLMLCLSKP